MKYFASIAVCLFLMVNMSHQIPRLVNCPPGFLDGNSAADSCGTLTCNDDGSYMEVGCGTWECLPELYLGYKEANNSKPFPDCCGGPICKDAE